MARGEVVRPNYDLSSIRLPYANEKFELENGLSVKQVRDLARSFVVGSFPLSIDEYRSFPDRYPRELMWDAGQIGLLGMDTPIDYQGEEFLPSQHAAAIEELARGDAGLALNILVQNSLTAYPIARYGTEEQKRELLPEMAKGNVIACFGLTEPNVGSDAKAIEAKATYEEGVGWIMKGRKRFITSANGAHIMVMDARTGPQEERGRTHTVFIVPLDNPNIHINLIPKIGQHGSQFCEVTFDNAVILEDAILGGMEEFNLGWGKIEDTLGHSRLLIAAQGTGIAMHAYDLALKYAQEREQFGKPIYELPALRQTLDHIKRQVDIARLLVKKAAWQIEHGDPNATLWASLAKLVAGETAIFAAKNSQLIHGGDGFTALFDIGKVMVDASVIRIYEGTAHIQKLILEKKLDRELLRPFLPDSASLLVDDPVNLPTPEALLKAVEGWQI